MGRLCAAGAEVVVPLRGEYDEAISIRDLLARITALTGHRGRVVWSTTRPGGQHWRLDVSRAGETFGFNAQALLIKGLRETTA